MTILMGVLLLILFMIALGTVTITFKESAVVETDNRRQRYADVEAQERRSNRATELLHARDRLVKAGYAVPTTAQIWEEAGYGYDDNSG